MRKALTMAVDALLLAAQVATFFAVLWLVWFAAWVFG